MRKAKVTAKVNLDKSDSYFHKFSHNRSRVLFLYFIFLRNKAFSVSGFWAVIIFGVLSYFFLLATSPRSGIVPPYIGWNVDFVLFFWFF